MPSVLLWLPLILNLVAWILFFFFLRHFTGRQFLDHRKSQEEQVQHLQKQTSLLQRIAAALEKHG